MHINFLQLIMATKMDRHIFLYSKGGELQKTLILKIDVQ